MDNLEKLEMVIETFQECARECEGKEGLSIIHFSCIPADKSDKNHGVVCGTPANLIVTVLKAMAKNDTIKRIIMTAAASYTMFDKIAGDQVRNSK